MPKPKAKAKRDRAAYMREYRARNRAAKSPPVEAVPVPDDPVGALAAWSLEKLRVPPGHRAAGEPMELPDFAVDFLRAGWDAHESALSTARKNAKSAICAVLALGHLCGPLRRPGWRGAIASISKEKASELRTQVAAIAEASGLDVRIRRSPYPGVIESPFGKLETLSADRGAGHSAGFDLVVIDETGLLPERGRDLLAGLRSSVSAKGGRIVHISILGDSPLFAEVLANPATVSRVYTAPDDCELGDVAAWEAANPGLGTIKQRSYMRLEVERVSGVPSDEPNFRALDLNQKRTPSREMIISPSDLKPCFVADPPKRSGRCFLAFDFGEATSGTAACAIWPESGRVETWLAFGNKPDLKKRGLRDDAPYLAMQARGELRTYPGRIVRPEAFLADIQTDISGQMVERAAADSYKDSEVKDFLDAADVAWPIDFRRVGAGKDGGRDCRAFQRLVHRERLRMLENLSLVSAVQKSQIRRDGNGNPGLDRASSRGRIDVLSAVVIACGLSESSFDRPRRRGPRFFVA